MSTGHRSSRAEAAIDVGGELTAPADGLCIVCKGILTGRKKKFCSADCSKLEGRRQWVLSVYGLTLEEFDVILVHQDGRCALCGKPPKDGQLLHVDHSHENGQSGRVRGLLCMRCNRYILGKLSKETILKLAEYVTNPPAEKALGRVVIAAGRPKKKRAPRKRRRSNG